MPNFILNIQSADDYLSDIDSSVQCFMVNADMEISALKKICTALLGADKIVLLSGQKAIELYAPLKADGVVLDLSAAADIKKEISAARRIMKGGILGVVSRCRRHEAMIVSENEPDFIIFKIWRDGSEQTLELCKWYAGFFLLQQAVMPQDDDAGFDEYPADMVILTPRRYKIFVAKK